MTITFPLRTLRPKPGRTHDGCRRRHRDRVATRDTTKANRLIKQALDSRYERSDARQAGSGRLPLAKNITDHQRDEIGATYALADLFRDAGWGYGELLAWMLSGTGRLGGARPADVITSDPAAVVAAALRELDPAGP